MKTKKLIKKKYNTTTRKIMNSKIKRNMNDINYIIYLVGFDKFISILTNDDATPLYFCNQSMIFNN